MRTSPPRLRHGFTLVELLTVIAIVAVLATILIALVGSARNQAMVVENTSNIRQIYTAGQMYVSENDGQMPDHQFDKLFPWRSYAVFWPSIGSPGLGNLLIQGQIDDPKVFYSPFVESERHTYEAFANDFAQFRTNQDPGNLAVRCGYMYNPDRLRDPQTGQIADQFRTVHDIDDPSTTVMVMDLLVDQTVQGQKTPPAWCIVMADGSAKRIESAEAYHSISGGVSNDYNSFLQILDDLLDR